MKEYEQKVVKEPRIPARYLADYMAASERGKRSIVAACKYPPSARLVQHDAAKNIISNWERAGRPGVDVLTDKAQGLRDKLEEDPFLRDVLDHNADYVDRYAKVFEGVTLPKADFMPPRKFGALVMNGVKVAFDPNLLFQRTTKTNEIRVGGAMFRYAKGKALSPEAAAYQSAFIFGYWNHIGDAEGVKADHKLCVTIDAYKGVCYAAPGDALTRFKNMNAACASIAEWWPNISPPSGKAT